MAFFDKNDFSECEWNIYCVCSPDSRKQAHQEEDGWVADCTDKKWHAGTGERYWVGFKEGEIVEIYIDGDIKTIEFARKSSDGLRTKFGISFWTLTFPLVLAVDMVGQNSSVEIVNYNDKWKSHKELGFTRERIEYLIGKGFKQEWIKNIEKFQISYDYLKNLGLKLILEFEDINDDVAYVKDEWNKLISADNIVIHEKIIENCQYIDDYPKYNKNFVRGSFLILKGKWHFSVKILTEEVVGIFVGLCGPGSKKQAHSDKDGWMIGLDGLKWHGNSYFDYADIENPIFHQNSIIELFVNADIGTLEFGYINLSGTRKRFGIEFNNLIFPLVLAVDLGNKSRVEIVQYQLKSSLELGFTEQRISELVDVGFKREWLRNIEKFQINYEYISRLITQKGLIFISEFGERIDGFVHIRDEWNSLLSSYNITINGREAKNTKYVKWDDYKNFVRSKFLIIGGKWHFYVKIVSNSHLIFVGICSTDSNKIALTNKNSWLLSTYSGKKLYGGDSFDYVSVSFSKNELVEIKIDADIGTIEFGRVDNTGKHEGFGVAFTNLTLPLVFCVDMLKENSCVEFG